MTPTSTPLSRQNWRAWDTESKRLALERLRAINRPSTDDPGHPLPGADTPWRTWLQTHFPSVCSRPFGARHARLWEWFEALEPGQRPRPRVEVWPRGGAKSTTTELGCARVGVRLARRFALYVSETQDQADKHVGSIGSLFEALGVGRAVNQYGNSKGWRRNQLRTENGFNVAAYGLDVAARGVKLDHYRPDLIIFDDIDSQDDTPRTTEKKINSITTAIIPAESSDCAFLFVQNLIHEDGVVAQLVDGRADFLHDREPAYVEPAVRGLQYETVARADGLKSYRVTGGEPTWLGQDLTVCEKQINAWGLRAFKREAQHEVAGAGGYFFDTGQLNYLDASELPRDLRRCRAWDLAATEGGGDYTAGALIGVRGQMPDLQVYILDLRRGQWGSENVNREIEQAAKQDGPAVKLRIPQDPAAAGKRQAEADKQRFKEYRPVIVPVTGSKATRAKTLADVVNRGNCWLVRADWNAALTEELRKFREDESHLRDDQVDACSDGVNELVGPEVSFFSL